MCFSAEAGFTAAAILLTAGAIGIQRAYRTDRGYLPLAALPIFFGFQQLFEGLVWTGNALSSDTMVQRFSLAYMFFSWLAWPVWIPHLGGEQQSHRTLTRPCPTMMKGAQKQQSSDKSHAHGFMGLFHVLHAPRRVTLLHRGLGHVESRRRLLHFGGIGHLGDHVIHLFHMSIIAEILRGIGRTDS
jgi:hypothetical protein